MNNYVPNSEADRLALCEHNILYTELFERRMASAGCSECDCTDAEMCADCWFRNNRHKYEDSGIADLVPLKDFAKAIKPFKKKKVTKIFKCPCRRTWTGEVAMYTVDGKGQMCVGNVFAKFCPLCGRNLTKTT